MKHILFPLLLLCTISLHAQINWQKKSLSERVSIAFPETPKETVGNGMKSLILKLSDSTANLIAVENDLQVTMGLDEATLEATMENEETWEQAKIAFVSSMGADATLVQEEKIMVKDRKALKLVINRKTDKNAINVLTVLIFTKGAKSYNIIFNSRAGKGDEKVKEAFFNSIEIS